MHKLTIEFNDEQWELLKELSQLDASKHDPHTVDLHEVLPAHMKLVDKVLEGDVPFSRGVAEGLALKTAVEMTEKGIIGEVLLAMDKLK